MRRGNSISAVAAIAVFAVPVAFWSCGGAAPSQSSGSQLPPGLGGSDYAWYHLDPPCSREPYGVIYNYDTASATINSQLQKMYSNGQRRLRIPIYFARGINSGTIMDSTGGNLSPQFQANLANLLAAIKAAGFEEIEVGFFPQSANNLSNGPPSATTTSRRIGLSSRICAPSSSTAASPTTSIF